MEKSYCSGCTYKDLHGLRSCLMFIPTQSAHPYTILETFSTLIFCRCCCHVFFFIHLNFEYIYQLHTAYWIPYLSELDSINTFYRFTAVFIDIITAETFFSPKAHFNGIDWFLANLCEFGGDRNIWKMVLSTSIVLNNIILFYACCVYWKTFLITFVWAKMAKSKRAEIQFIFICLSVFFELWIVKKSRPLKRQAKRGG